MDDQHEEIVNWIKGAKGYSFPQLYSALIQQGYDQEVAKKAIIEASKPPQKDQVKPMKLPINLLLLLLIGIISVSIVITILLYVNP